MNNLNVIDSFLATFIQYLDSGFGLLKGDAAHLSSILIGIDVTLAVLFWVLDNENNLISRLVKKILYVGAFAFILSNFKALSEMIFNSFTSMGLKASANSLSSSDLLHPGKLAGIGFEAAHPLLDQAAKLSSLESLIPNLLVIIVLLFAWFMVIMAFFILAIQVFITILEFKLVSLAGFTLVPFALWNKTAFLAERVLGHVVTSGIKVMVLAVIIGIGSSFFGQFIGALSGQEPDLAQAMSLVLASLTLLGLGIYGPSIASGLVTGAPQLGAGSALGTMGAAAGTALLAAGAIGGAGRAVMGGASSIKSATRMGGSEGGGGGKGADSGSGSGSGQSPQKPASPSGSGGTSGSSDVSDPSLKTSSQAASEPTSAGAAQSGSSHKASPQGASPTQPPDWATRMQSEQRLRSHLHMAQSAIAAGDQPSSSAHPDLSQKE